MVQKIHPRGVIGVPNSGPYVKRFQIRVLLSEGSILEPSLNYPILPIHLKIPVTVCSSREGNDKNMK